MRNFLEIKGSHYEIGYHLGKYWGDYFQKLEKNKGQGRQKKKLVEKYLHEWISRESRYWNREYEPLLENTMKHFPEIIYEIEGMEKGVTESGLSTSLMNCLSASKIRNNFQFWGNTLSPSFTPSILPQA